MTPSYFPVSAVLFDFDGVLWDSQGSLIAAKQLLRSPGFQWSCAASRATPMEIVRRFETCDFGNTFRSLRSIYSSFADLLPARYHRFRFIRKMGYLYPKYDLKFGNLMPGVIDTLHELREFDIPLAIVSNSMKKRIFPLVTKFGLLKLFDIIITRDDLRADELKPAPFPILRCLLKIKWRGKISRDDVYFVGDLPTDVQCAHSAKVRSIAVTTGHGTINALRAQRPDYIIPRLENLFEIPSFQKLRNSL